MDNLTYRQLVKYCAQYRQFKLDKQLIMTVLISVLGAIFAIYILVIVHEFGHFFMARRVGITVERFSIGFGPTLWSRQAKDGTLYRVGLLPLGGYVKMLGDEVETPAESQSQVRSDAYCNKPVWARLLVVLAGPIVNLLLAVVIYAVLNMIGGYRILPMIGTITPQSAAAQAGLQPMQHITAVDGSTSKTWMAIRLALVRHLGEPNARIRLTTADSQGKVFQYVLLVASWSVKPGDDLIEYLGIHAYQPPIPPVISQVLADSPAQAVGLQTGDRILAVNSQPINDWWVLMEQLQKIPDSTVQLTLARSGKTLIVPVRLAEQRLGLERKKIGFLGVAPVPVSLPKNLQVREQTSFWGAWLPALQQTYDLIATNLIVLKKILTDQMSIKTLSGPVTVFYLAGQMSLMGILNYLSFLAFISTALGFMNLLPIPGLDGGHVVFLSLEALRRKPLPVRVQMLVTQCGFALLILLMLQATWNDLARVLSG